MTTPERPATGIRLLPSGKWQAYIRVRGEFISETFPHRTSLTLMKRWRETQKIQARNGQRPQPLDGATLADDVKSYLLQRQTMTTLRHRTDDLQLWLNHFGRNRVRKSITAGEIRAQLETWRAQGYAASTVNHRRTALMSLWTVLDGISAPNPARDVPRFTEAQGPPRALSQAAVLALLDAMGSSQTRARLELLRWTGWPPAQIAKLEPADIRWDEAVYVRPRRKGKGVAGAWLPLLPEAWAALREFKRLGCWGEFSTSSARTSFRRAARHARRAIAKAYWRRTIPKAEARAIRRELLDVTPYQLRHSFATLVAGITLDDRAVQTLLQHSDIRTSHLYTGATADPRALAGLAKVSAALTHTKGETP
jgi:integrase